MGKAVLDNKLSMDSFIPGHQYNSRFKTEVNNGGICDKHLGMQSSNYRRKRQEGGNK
ncbi:hypothetical protein [Metabacillus arenae]|uniref:Uncharacterized protein n=1 Tax=Metabacillus arenae TaxID=2771434 RepID=A0A926NL23_9BACI|nr:hypothetical protein [Metabacillus arenae]MBD1383336.1 hypothetical protein [Metabacillus arenae]